MKHEIRNKESKLNYCFQPFLFLLPQAIKYAKAMQRKRLENEDNVSRSAEFSKFFILLC